VGVGFWGMEGLGGRFLGWVLEFLWGGWGGWGVL
jgi:hypothetical protein